MRNILLTGLVFFALNAKIVMAKEKGKIQNVQLQVTEKGFVPDQISVKPGTHVILKVTRKTDATCAKQIVIKEKKIKKELPLNQEVAVDAGVLEKGKVTFACGMDMVSGFIVAE